MKCTKEEHSWQRLHGLHCSVPHWNFALVESSTINWIGFHHMLIYLKKYELLLINNYFIYFGANVLLKNLPQHLSRIIPDWYKVPNLWLSNITRRFHDYLSPWRVRQEMFYDDHTVLSFEESLAAFSHDN